jgi:transcriptional regulator with XRE-family HTH domain
MTRGEADGTVDRSGLDPTVVGARIRARRKHLGLTLQNVADAADVSKSFVSQIEIGKTWPSVGVLEQISAALSTSPVSAKSCSGVMRSQFGRFGFMPCSKSSFAISRGLDTVTRDARSG